MPQLIEGPWIGIDPGSSGGLAAITSGGACCVSMPATERDVWDWVSSMGGFKTQAYIEKVHAMPGNGVSGMFKFGMSYGSLRMALTAAGISWEEVTPQAWQKEMMSSLPKKAKDETQTVWKNRLKAKAQQLFPQIKVTLATADALLIAEFCRRKCQGKLSRGG